MAVQPVGGMERKEAGHADNDRPQHFVPDVEVEVREAAALGRQDAVVWILGGILRYRDAEGTALFHAFEDEIDTVGPALLHAAQGRQHIILFADTFVGPFHGDFVIAGEGFHPVAIIVGALAEHLFADHRDAQDLADEMDHLFRSGQAAEVAVNDDAVEAVVYKNEQAVEQLCEQLHRSPPGSCLSNKIIGEAAGGVNRDRRARSGREERVSKGKETAGFVPFGLRRRLWQMPESTLKHSVLKFQICLARPTTSSRPAFRRTG